MALRFCGLSVVLLGAWIYLWTKKNKLKVKIHRVHGLWFIYVLFSALSIINAYNVVDSIFELSKIILVGTLILFFQVVFQGKEVPLKKISRIITVAAFFQCCVGYAQKFNILDVYGATSGHLGTMTHPNQYSIHLMMMFPFVVMNILFSKGKEKVASATILSLMSIMLILTKTRSVWVGMVIIMIFAVVLVASSPVLKSTYRTLIKKNMAIILSWLIVTTALGVVCIMSDYKEISEHVFDLVEAKSSGRGMLWNYTIGMVNDHPIIGVGIGNWKLNIPVHGTVFFQRPHNDFLWIVSESGIVALVSYVLFLGFILRNVFKGIKESQKEEQLFLFGVFLMLAGFCVVSLFTFPKERVMHLIYFSLGCGAALNGMSKQRNIKGILLPSISIKIIVVMIVLISWFGYKRLVGERNLNRILSQLTQVENCKKYESIDQDYYSIDQTSTPINFHKGICYLKQQNYTAANSFFLKAFNLYPMHKGNLVNIASTYGALKEYDQAKKYYLKALSWYPNDTELLINLAVIWYYKKNKGEVRKIIEGINERTLENRDDLKSRVVFLKSYYVD